MTMIKILHERWKCIGCGSCVAVDPTRWELADDNCADLKDSKHTKTKDGTKEERTVSDLLGSKDAEDLCPVNCIHVTQE